MDNNKIIILALIVVIAALLVGIGAMMLPNMTKTDTKVAYKSNATLNEGDAIKIRLVDADGNGLADATVNITITDNNKASDYHSVVTNDNGVGTLKLDKKAGKYKVTIIFNGDDKHNGCNTTKSITVKEEEVAEAETSSSTPSAYAYKSDGTPMYSQAEVDQYMLNKYGMVDYHVGSNGYIDMDEPGYDDAGHRLW
ncbi:Ig-like domain-containing protein [Methanobrevibacter sp.]|uniref:Ig-like domain-containing protein n=1 Tax=Methanobrevibacter sp. TaxID=66852 RepID=UPI0026DEE741|nr:Ig-like domain-containing protein [Methanobrevibacter sp.]MDO5859870.1 Ig-like domain-containing protein [Methanobrevibacter sp.]